MMAERPVDFTGIGINEQLTGVEAVTFLVVPGTFGPEAIAGAGFGTSHNAVVHIAQSMGQRETVKFNVSGFIKNAEVYPRGVPRNDSDIHAIAAKCNAERRRPPFGFRDFRLQVITEGLDRPVRVSMPARLRDSAMRSASAVCVSIACFLGSGSKRSI